MSSYILRHTDDQLWKRVKAKAALQGVTVKAVIEKFLKDWVSQ